MSTLNEKYCSEQEDLYLLDPSKPLQLSVTTTPTLQSPTKLAPATEFHMSYMFALCSEKLSARIAEGTALKKN